MKKSYPLLICLFLLVLISCLSKKDETPETARLQDVSYQDSVYLEFEGNLYEPLIIRSHMDIYIPAYNRLMRHVYIKNNRLVTDLKSGEEIRISENIFEYLIDAINDGNEKLSQSTEYAIYQNKFDGFYIVMKNSKHISDFMKKLE